jgi:hypothetical protein
VKESGTKLFTHRQHKNIYTTIRDSQFASPFPLHPLKWREANTKPVRKQWPFERLFFMASMSYINICWEVEVWLHAFLILALDGGRGHFTPGYNTSQYTLERRQGGPRRYLPFLSTLKLEETDSFETQLSTLLVYTPSHPRRQ